MFLAKESGCKLDLKMCFHPAGKRPVLAAGVAAFLGFMGSAMWFVMQEPYVPLVLMGVMVYSLVPFYIPTYYSFDQEGVTVKRWGRAKLHKWSDYRSYSVQGNGMVFWADTAAPSKITSLGKQVSALRRSVFLSLDEEMLKQAEPLVRKKLVRASAD